RRSEFFAACLFSLLFQELTEATVLPRSQRDQKRRPRAFLQRHRAIAIHDLGALAHRILQYPPELRERAGGHDAAVENELAAAALKVRRQKFLDELLVNVVVHGPARPPREVTADEHARAVVGLQLDDPQPIELDEIAQRLAPREIVHADDIVELPAIEHQPGHQKQLRVRDHFLLLRQRQLIDRRRLLLHLLDQLGHLESGQLTDQIEALEREVARGEQAFDARFAQLQMLRHVRVREAAPPQCALELGDDLGSLRHARSAPRQFPSKYHVTILCGALRATWAALVAP